MAITSLTLSSMCSCAWLQSSAPPPRLRICCYSSTQHSVHQTLTHIHSSGVIACLHANSAELALKVARAALSGGISVVLPSVSPSVNVEDLNSMMMTYGHHKVNASFPFIKEEKDCITSAPKVSFASPTSGLKHQKFFRTKLMHIHEKYIMGTY